MKQTVGMLTLFLGIGMVTYSQGTADFTALVRTNASTFHKNFSKGAFENNGPLVTENIYVNSNNAILVGRENFVNRIKRYNGPFPGLQLKDRIVLIDGNIAAVHYILQGVQKGAYGDIPASGNKVEGMSAEFFVMDRNAHMKDLLTITQLDKLAAECKGDIHIDNYQAVTLLPVVHHDAAYKQKIKDVLDAYLGTFNARKWEELGALIGDGVHINWNGQMQSGAATLLGDLKTHLGEFPDLVWQLDREVVDGDRAAIAYTMIGKQEGTGKMLMVREAQYFQFDSAGKIIDVIAVSNSNDFKTQLR